MFGIRSAWIQEPISCLYYINLMTLKHGQTKHFFYICIYFCVVVENSSCNCKSHMASWFLFTFGWENFIPCKMKISGLATWDYNYDWIVIRMYMYDVYNYSNKFIFMILIINTDYWYIVLYIAVVKLYNITFLLSYQFSEYQLNILWIHSCVMIIQ